VFALFSDGIVETANAMDDQFGVDRAASLQLAAPSTDVYDVAGRKMPVPGGEVGLRIYTPRPGSEDRPFPIAVHLHGAGFVAGDLDTHDSIARFHCKHADAVVIAVDYRLAPEHPFPAAVDAYAAVEWAVEHARELNGDARRIAVLGDSAGGNLAAVVCQLAKARNGPRIAFQGLVYPVVDFRPGAAYLSRSQFGGGDFSCRIATWSSSGRAISLTCGRRAALTSRRCSPTIWLDCRRRSS
jgi:acetyl esterase/lipase